LDGIRENENGTSQAMMECLVLKLAALVYDVIPARPVAEKLPVRMGLGLKLRWLAEGSAANARTRCKRDAGTGAVVARDPEVMDTSAPSSTVSRDALESDDDEREVSSTSATISSGGRQRQPTAPPRPQETYSKSLVEDPDWAHLAGIDDTPCDVIGGDDMEGGTQDADAAADGDCEEDLVLDLEDAEGKTEQAKTVAERTNQLKERYSEAALREELLVRSGLIQQHEPAAWVALEGFYASEPWSTLLALFLDKYAPTSLIVDCLRPPRELCGIYDAAISAKHLAGVVVVQRGAYDGLPSHVRGEIKTNLLAITDAARGDIGRSSAFVAALSPRLERHIEHFPDGFYVNNLDVKSFAIALVTCYPVKACSVYDVDH